MSNCEKVMSIDDLRRKIFSYLRKEAKIKCRLCERVCVWDKRICYYITFNPKLKYGAFATIPRGNYCIKCWTNKGLFTNNNCTIN